MDFIEFIFIILFLFVFFIFWSNILTKDSTFGVDNLKLLVWLTLVSFFLFIFWGIYVINSTLAWLNIFVVAIMAMHTFLANKRYTSYWWLFLFEVALMGIYLFIYFYYFPSASKTASIDFILACGNYGLCILDYFGLAGKELKQKRNEIESKVLKSIISEQMHNLFARFLAENPRGLSDQQQTSLEIMLQGSSSEWLDLPDEIQDLYFRSLVKKLKK